MRILALEPLYGGGRQAFLEEWSNYSQFEWTILGLPAYEWAWRMRHSSVCFADLVAKKERDGEQWDALLCSDMLDLASFKGLSSPATASLPSIAYFHENQLGGLEQEAWNRGDEFGMVNMNTALAANRVWFNSAYHQDLFLEDLDAMLRRMPDHQHFDSVDTISSKSEVYPEGIPLTPGPAERDPGPLRILWIARNVDEAEGNIFFRALDLLVRDKVDFRINIIGPGLKEPSAFFAAQHEKFKEFAQQWGYQECREDDLKGLHTSDVVVSTVQKDLVITPDLEAVCAGAYPLFPNRLAYPELFDPGTESSFFYDGRTESLAHQLKDLSVLIQDSAKWRTVQARAVSCCEHLRWDRLAPKMDEALAAL